MLRQFEVAPEVTIDVSEDAKAYTVRAEIPGVDKKDIDVSVDGNKVAISAEVRRQAEQKDGERLVHAERYYGKVYRAFTVPAEIDAAKVGASYDQGVLTLTQTRPTSFHLYPNPASDIIQIINEDIENGRSEIFNMSGQRVWNIEINNRNSS